MNFHHSVARCPRRITCAEDLEQLPFALIPRHNWRWIVAMHASNQRLDHARSETNASHGETADHALF